jgi:hypothetical protein
MNAIPINVRRTDAVLRPDLLRVLLPPFPPGDLQRLETIVTAILSISESGVGLLIAAIPLKFSERHPQISNSFNERLKQLRRLSQSIRRFQSNDDH